VFIFKFIPRHIVISVRTMFVSCYICHFNITTSWECYCSP